MAGFQGNLEKWELFLCEGKLLANFLEFSPNGKQCLPLSLREFSLSFLEFTLHFPALEVVKYLI